MITHVSYDERGYASPRECLIAIRAHIDRGWLVVQVRGPEDGPFIVLFRMNDAT
jgi:hypothetical protein